MLETVFDMKKPNWKENLGSKSNAFHSQADLRREKFNCRKCNENHPLKQCKKLLELSVKDRINFVYANKYCKNSISPNHFKSKCPSKGLCFRYKRKHHTLLHIGDENTRVLKEAFPRNGETVSYNTHVISNERPKLSPIDLGSLSHGRTVILPTVLTFKKQAGELFMIWGATRCEIRKEFCILKSSTTTSNSCETISL